MFRKLKNWVRDDQYIEVDGDAVLVPSPMGIWRLRLWNFLILPSVVAGFFSISIYYFGQSFLDKASFIVAGQNGHATVVKINEPKVCTRSTGRKGRNRTVEYQCWDLIVYIDELSRSVPVHGYPDEPQLLDEWEITYKLKPSGGYSHITGHLAGNWKALLSDDDVITATILLIMSMAAVGGVVLSIREHFGTERAYKLYS